MRTHGLNVHQMPSTNHGYISNVRITKGNARYATQWWWKWLMPWKVSKFYRKPLIPFLKKDL